MTPEEEIMDFLNMRVFNSILESPNATNELKSGTRYTMMRLDQLDARGMVNYFWSAIVGTERSISFAQKLRDAGFQRFEEVIDEFRSRFNRHAE